MLACRAGLLEDARRWPLAAWTPCACPSGPPPAGKDVGCRAPEHWQGRRTPERPGSRTLVAGKSKPEEVDKQSGKNQTGGDAALPRGLCIARYKVGNHHLKDVGLSI